MITFKNMNENDRSNQLYFIKICYTIAYAKKEVIKNRNSLKKSDDGRT